MNRPRLPLRPLLLAAILAGVGVVHAQAPELPTGPRTGDPWTDARLADINLYGATYRDAFIDELVRYHRAPRDLVLALLARPDWTPADVYIACGLAVQAGKPCRSVAEARPSGSDWGAVARDLGILPGSPGFHALKRAMVASYHRWARPVVLDAELAADNPRRAQKALEEQGGKERAAGDRKLPASESHAMDSAPTPVP